MSQSQIFDQEIPLPDETLSIKEGTLIGFEEMYKKVSNQLRLLLSSKELADWNRKHHGGKLALVGLVSDQYPLIVFCGDVGTGKTATAECIANKIVAESKTEDSVLFKLSNRVRGSGKVGEMGTLLAEAFVKVGQAAGKGRRAILIIDEGDSLASSRSQAHSHHEDKVAVNTLIQGIDDLRKYQGRVVTILCTNRLSVLDPAIQRRAAIIEEFKRPNAAERRQLFELDLGVLNLSEQELSTLVDKTGEHEGLPGWTYSDIRTRIYPMALAQAFPNKPLTFDHLIEVIQKTKPSPAVQDA